MLDGLYMMKNGDVLATDWVVWLALPMEQDHGNEEACDRVQRSGRSVRIPKQQRSDGGGARSGQGRVALRAAWQIAFKACRLGIKDRNIWSLRMDRSQEPIKEHR